MLTFILICLIFLAAGFIQGLAGFGSSIVAMPLLTMLIDLKSAVALCILNGLIITSYLCIQLRPHLDKRKILPLFIGSLPGIYFGVHVLKTMDTKVMELLLGLLIVIYSLYSLRFKPQVVHMRPFWAYGAGFATGLIGAAFSAGGPPSIIYTTLTGWSKDHIKATLAGFFLSSSIIIAVMHAASGITSEMVLQYFSASVLFVAGGVYYGLRLYGRIGRHGYIKLILVLLLILGIIMTGSAVMKW